MQQSQLITTFHLPPVPTEPLSLPTSPLLLLCLYSLQTLCGMSPVVHLCAHNCSAHAIPRSCVSQQLFPSSRSCFPVHLFHGGLWILDGGGIDVTLLAEVKKVSYSHHFDQFWVSVLTVADPNFIHEGSTSMTSCSSHELPPAHCCHTVVRFQCKISMGVQAFGL